MGNLGGNLGNLGNLGVWVLFCFQMGTKCGLGSSFVKGGHIWVSRRPWTQALKCYEEAMAFLPEDAKYSSNFGVLESWQGDAG